MSLAGRVRQIGPRTFADVRRAFCCWPSSQPFLAGAQVPELTEHEIKAAFLYNFAKFVDWPPEAFSSPTDGIHLCVLGKHSVTTDLQQLSSGKMIGDRPVRAQSVGVFHIKSCHMLFIGASGNVPAREALQAAREASVLTVGETAEFIEQGGMISFVVESNRIRFEVNLRATQEARLKLSSKLLSLAKSVQQ